MAKQNEILDNLTNILQDDDKYQALETFLNLIQNNSLQTNLNELSEFKQKKDEIQNEHKEISEILEDIKISQKHIDEIYYKIYNIENGENERNSSQALIDIQDAQNKAQTMKESYRQLYDMQDSQGNITQGIVTKLEEACKQIEENKDDIANFKAFYKEVFETEKDENGKIIQLSLSEFIDKKKEEMEDLLEMQEEKFDKLYEEKDSLLTNLYDPTTAEGLAKAYMEEKKNIQKSIKW